MSDPFIGEVKITGFGFPPKGWAACNGQSLPIAQNQALFAILGITYGGNGTTTFNLPNLIGRAPIGWGNGAGLPAVTIGQSGGEAAHTLTIDEMASHGHTANGSSATASASVPAGGMLATADEKTYAQSTPTSTLNASAVGSSGGGQSHDNMQPYQVLNFIIALTGIFPSRS